MHNPDICCYQRLKLSHGCLPGCSSSPFFNLLLPLAFYNMPGIHRDKILSSRVREPVSSVLICSESHCGFNEFWTKRTRMVVSPFE